MSQKQELKVMDVSNHFAGLVEKNIASLTSNITSQEAKRLTMNLIVKANNVLESSDRGYGWGMVDTNRFLVDILKCVTLGLDAANNECYPIPYMNNKTKKLELQCSPSAWGLKKIVTEYAIGSPVKDVRAFIVRDSDHFTVKYTALDDIWTYEADLFGKSAVIGYATVIVREDGTSNVMVHSLEDIKKRRDASKSPNSPAWTKWPHEMALAKAVRRHCSKITYKLPDDKQEAFDALDDDSSSVALEQRLFANSEPLSLDAEIVESVQEVEAVEQAEKPVKAAKSKKRAEPMHEPEPVQDDGFPTEAEYQQELEQYGMEF